MAKLLLITDQHFGVRDGNAAVQQHQEEFYRDFVLPFIRSSKVDAIIDLGDTFDKRKTMDMKVLQDAKRAWFDPLREIGIPVHTLVGNHTAYFKTNNDVNTIELMLSEYDNLIPYSRPTEIEIDGVSLLMMPWICPGNFEECMSMLSSTTSQLMFGHLEVRGFEMYRGSPSDHGYDPSIFKKFDMVFSGHYHHRSTKGNIHYLGAPYEMTWSDYDDARGFHVFDTETRELTFHRNPNRLFLKIVYDDSKIVDLESMRAELEQIRDGVCGSYVKIIVSGKTNPYWFDIFVDSIEKMKPVDVQVVDDHLNMQEMTDDSIIDEAEDTLSIIRKYAAQVSSDSSTAAALDRMLGDLYLEALKMEVAS